MTTTATRTPTQPPKRVSSSSPSLSPPPLSRPALSARSAVPPRVTSAVKGPVRRTSLRGATPPSHTTGVNGTETKEWLSTQLKQETEHKEQLLLQLENKEQSIVQITKENDQLSSSLKTAESRLVELYADQRRGEDELGARIEVIEKLRSQVRELEREKREVQRRYNEQTSTFEAERQAFYDNEQHLKSRIQSLSQARRQPALPSPSIHEYESETEAEEEEPPTPVLPSTADDPNNEPPEVTALKLELSTLSTSHDSVQNTLILLQSQLIDLKRVNQELQEENESYNILLRERTLTGQFDLSKRLNGAPSDNTDSDSVARSRDDDTSSMRSTSRSLLDPVDETPEGGAVDLSHVNGFSAPDNDSVSSGHRPSGRHSRRNNNGSTASQSPARGETLADLPITGPGLDLAAELGRAENKDPYDPSGRRSRRASTADRRPSGGNASQPEVAALRNEVKVLKDANKALSLYASKILDRIIATEGFEHVLAVDYSDKSEPAPVVQNSDSPPKASKKPRPQSVMVGRTVSNSSDNYPSPMLSPTERLTTFDNIRTEATSTKTPTTATAKASRRSLSFDWKGFSVFGGGAGDKKPESSNLRALTLKTGGNSVLGARKLDTEEDEEDRRERERLNATMKLMGIEKPADTPAPIIERGASSSAATPTAPNPSRFSFFRRSTVITPNNNSEQSSLKSASSNTSSPYLGGTNPNLTQEALEQAEVEGKIAQLDAREKSLSVELANGNGSGFTEIRRSSRRSRKSDEQSSGSTIWSAGMSQGAHDD